jgi:hypothetical protein
MLACAAELERERIIASNTVTMPVVSKPTRRSRRGCTRTSPIVTGAESGRGRDDRRALGAGAHAHGRGGPRSDTGRVHLVHRSRRKHRPGEGFEERIEVERLRATIRSRDLAARPGREEAILVHQARSPAEHAAPPPQLTNAPTHPGPGRHGFAKAGVVPGRSGEIRRERRVSPVPVATRPDRVR